MASYYFDLFDSHPNVIVLVVKSEHKLLEVAEKLQTLGIIFKEFREPDIGNQMTALATIPLFGENRKFFAKFQLFRGSYGP